jgi:hypothetical protein
MDDPSFVIWLPTTATGPQYCGNFPHVTDYSPNLALSTLVIIILLLPMGTIGPSFLESH